MKKHITRRRVTIVVGALLLLLWWLWPNNQLARVQAIQKEMADVSLTPEQRREKGQELRAAMEKLSSQQRTQLRGDFQKRMQERMAQYFAMSPQEKQKYLDQQIDQMPQMSQQGQPKGGPGPGGPGGPGGGSQSAEDKERRRQQRLDNSTPEFRAQMDQFRKDMELRRQQRGLPPAPTRGGR